MFVFVSVPQRADPILSERENDGQLCSDDEEMWVLSDICFLWNRERTWEQISFDSLLTWRAGWVRPRNCPCDAPLHLDNSFASENRGQGLGLVTWTWSPNQLIALFWCGLQQINLLLSFSWMKQKTKICNFKWLFHRCVPDDGRTKPKPRKERGASHQESSEHKCLVRASLGNKKISTVVSTRFGQFVSTPLQKFARCKSENNSSHWFVARTSTSETPGNTQKCAEAYHACKCEWVQCSIQMQTHLLTRQWCVWPVKSSPCIENLRNNGNWNDFVSTWNFFHVDSKKVSLNKCACKA